MRRFHSLPVRLGGEGVMVRVDAPLGELAGSVVAWMGEVGYSELTLSMAAEGLQRFVGFAVAHGVDRLDGVTEGLAAGFVDAPCTDGSMPAVPTRHHRRATLRVFFRVLHSFDASVVDPTWALELPSRSTDACRPLTDDELDVLRAVSLATLSSTRQPAIVALAEAGAVTTEIAKVTAADIDLDAATVALHGCFHARARVVPLTEWGTVQLSRRIRDLDDAQGPVAYAGADRRNAGQATISTKLRRLFTRAGLSAETDLGLASVRAWAGRRAFDETGRIDAAAQVLGCRGLDTAARLIGWDWQDGR